MLKKNNLLLKILLITISLNILMPAGEDFGNILLHHVTNNPNEVYLPIEIGDLDLSITKHIILLWTIAALVITLALLGTKRYRKNKKALPSKFSGLFEILTLNEEIRELIVNKASSEKIQAASIKNGMYAMHDSGLSKALNGITTVDELARVLDIKI